ARTSRQVTSTVVTCATTFRSVSAPANATAGTAFSITVTAQDQFGNTVTNYAGTVHFTSSDGQAVLPSNSTLTNGTGTFSVTLKTTGGQTVSAADTVTSSISGTTNTITVNPATASILAVVASTGTTTAGSAFNVTVTAKDAFGNTATGYAGIVHFTSTDGQAVLPANYTFVAGDSGTHIFSTILKTAGAQTVTATDTVTSSITGTTNSITVNPTTASMLAVVASTGTTTAGSTFNVTVTAKDAFGNTATGYAGTGHFTNTDAQAILPTNYTFM